jgi:hypothetical protein
VFTLGVELRKASVLSTGRKLLTKAQAYNIVNYERKLFTVQAQRTKRRHFLITASVQHFFVNLFVDFKRLFL